MDIEKIKVTTETGQTLEVVVLNKRAEHIEVVLGQGEGSVMGREIIYARSREQVQADIDRLNPNLRQSSRRR